MTFQEKLFKLVEQHLHDEFKEGIRGGILYNNVLYTAQYTFPLPEKKLRRCVVRYECFSNGLSISADCPIKADGENFRAILEQLTRWNIHEAGTYFDFDFSNGTISARTFLRFSELEEFSTKLVDQFMHPVAALVQHEDELLRLLEN